MECETFEIIIDDEIAKIIEKIVEKGYYKDLDTFVKLAIIRYIAAWEIGKGVERDEEFIKECIELLKEEPDIMREPKTKYPRIPDTDIKFSYKEQKTAKITLCRKFLEKMNNEIAEHFISRTSFIEHATASYLLSILRYMMTEKKSWKKLSTIMNETWR